MNGKILIFYTKSIGPSRLGHSGLARLLTQPKLQSATKTRNVAGKFQFNCFRTEKASPIPFLSMQFGAELGLTFPDITVYPSVLERLRDILD